MASAPPTASGTRCRGDAAGEPPASAGGPGGAEIRPTDFRAGTGLVDGLLELRAGGELRDVGGRDLHLLARAGVHALPGGAPRDVELAEAGERDGVAVLQGALDHAERRVDR